ncbi:MAG: septum formation initiator family protein [Akkermansiaceae bacterium]|nr:septum formation initiator family protein [Akkermansiaceae bacterium]MCF7733433.1 septum formation initiator family protein [Akkermansiaceae bacterium]
MAKRSQLTVRARRLEVRSRVLQGVVRVVFAVLGLSIGFVVVSTGVPQKRRLEELAAKLEQSINREEEVLAEREICEIEYQALRSDPKFLEIMAYDRLGWHREGERILIFRDR